MAIFLSLAALALLFLAGLGAVRLLCPRSPELSSAELCGTAMILGAGLIGGLYFVAGLVVTGPILRVGLAAVCMALPFAAWVRHREHLWDFRMPEINFAGILLVVLAAVQVAFVSWFSLERAHLGWDGLFVWEAKARAGFLNGGSIPFSYFHDAAEFFHTAYPPLVSVLEAWVYGFVGQMDQSMAKWVGPYFYLAATLLVIGYASRETNRRWTAVVVLGIFAMTPKLAFTDGSATSGYADFPLAAIYLCAVLHGFRYAQTGSAGSARLAGLSAMLLPLTKSEGSLLLLCVAGTVALAVWIRRDWRAGAWMVAPGVAALVSWAVFAALAGAPKERTFLPVTPRVLIDHLDRVRPLVGFVAGELTNWGSWSLLWPITAVVLVYLGTRVAPSYWYPRAAAIALPLMVYPCTYIFTAWELSSHVGSSLGRLVLHVAPAATVVTGMVLGALLDAKRETGQALLKRAAALLEPLGITLADLEDLPRNAPAEALLLDAAEVLRPTGISIEQLRQLYYARIEKGELATRLGKAR